MIRKFAVLIGFAALCGGMQPALAAPCEFTRTSWGLRLTNCKLNELFYGRYELSLDRIPDAVVRPWPNLRPSHISDTLLGGSVNIVVDVENVGAAAAGAFEVAVIGTVTDPLNGGVGVNMTAFPPIVIQSLPVGATVTRSAGSVPLPNRDQDWDVCTVAIVDPPTSTSSLGKLLETDETDNRRERCCRAYGPKPDFSGPPSC